MCRDDCLYEKKYVKFIRLRFNSLTSSYSLPTFSFDDHHRPYAKSRVQLPPPFLLYPSVRKLQKGQ